MTHGSLFSGGGGFDLAAEWAGWTNVFNCEIELFCKRILKYYWPDAIQYDDIRNTDFAVWRGRLDVLTGGFPCQPFSQAGKRKGTEDERHLWPEMLRAIQSIRPRWIVGENVYGIINWSQGMVFEQVCSDLEREGYEVQPYIIPAAGVGAPHKRDRVWFVAYHAGAGTKKVRQREDGVLPAGPITNGSGKRWEPRAGKTNKREKCSEIRGVIQCSVDRFGRSGFTSDTDNFGLEGRVFTQIYDKERRKDTVGHAQGTSRNSWSTLHPAPWENFPTQSPVCCRDDELSGRLDGITFLKWRQESIKLFGNAVVPYEVLQIFETINEYERLTNSI